MYKDKEKRRLYCINYRIKNRKKQYEYFKKFYELHKDEWSKYKKNKKPSTYFKNASPISKNCIKRHGINALIIYEKYNRKCANCGQDWDLTIHHIDHKGRNYIEKGLSPNNNIENLTVLCRKCHGSIHGKERRGKFKYKE